MQDYRNLSVWKKAHALALIVYSATASFPNEERYSLTSQLRRSAVSIGSNIAEGTGRSGNGDFGRFLHMAFGSACELEYQLLLAHDLKFLQNCKEDELFARINEVKRMLSSLLTKVKGDA